MIKKNTLFAALMVGTLLSTATAFAAISDDTNRFTLDEGEGRTAKDAVGAASAQITGTSTGFGWTSGVSGTALSFDGTLGESIIFPDGFVKGSEGSIAVWVKLNSLNDHNYIFSGRSTSDNYIYVTLMVDREGRPQLAYRTSSGATEQKVQGAKILNINEWYLIVLTGNGQTYHMFVNGEEVNAAGGNNGRWFSDITPHTLQYRAGSLDTTPLSGVFDGYIDEIRFYGRVLSQADVTELYNGGNAGTPTVPVGIRPALALGVTRAVVNYGDSVTVSWAGDKVDSCTASGDWNGSVPVSGSRTFDKLASSVSYALSCSGKGGVTSQSVSVTVLPKGQVATSTSTSGGLSVTILSPNSGTEMTGPVKGASLWKRNLMVGARGEDVRALQLVLIKKGYLVSVNATGYFGALTKAAAMKFQREHKLPETGFVGSLTRAKLDTEVQ